MDKTITLRLNSPRRRERRTLFGLSIIGTGSQALLDNFHLFDTPLQRTFRLAALAAVSLSVSFASAQAQGDATTRCPVVQDAAARLACYDAAFPPRAAATSQPAPTAPAALASPPAKPSASAPAPADPAAQFGLQQRLRPGELESIESRVVATFEGWGPNERIRLENGQVWEVVDGSSGTITPAMRKVTVRKGAFGSYFLDFEGLTKSPKVRRVQ